MFCFRSGMVMKAYNVAKMCLHCFGDFGMDLDSFINPDVHKMLRRFVSKRPKLPKLQMLSSTSLGTIQCAALIISALSLLGGKWQTSRSYLALAEAVDEAITIQGGPKVAMPYPSDFVSSTSSSVKLLLYTIHEHCVKADKMRTVKLTKGAAISVDAEDWEMSSDAASTQSEALSKSLNGKSDTFEFSREEFSSDKSMNGRLRGSSVGVNNTAVFESGFNHLKEAFMSWIAGRFSDTFGSLRRSVHYFSTDTNDCSGSCMRSILLIQSSWVALCAGQLLKAKALSRSVFDFANALSQPDLVKMSLEVKLLLIVLLTDYTEQSPTREIENSASVVRKFLRKDAIPPGMCAIIALSYALERDVCRALQYAKYAVQKLQSKTAITPTAGILLFIGGYAACMLYEQDQKYANSLPADVALAYLSSSQTSSTCESLVDSALHGLAVMKNMQPCLHVLETALACKLLGNKKNIGAEASDLLEVPSGPAGDQFAFGNAFLRLERAILASKISGTKQLMNRLFLNSAGNEFVKIGVPISTVRLMTAIDISAGSGVVGQFI
jgi:hypothetical protein